MGNAELWAEIQRAEAVRDVIFLVGLAGILYYIGAKLLPIIAAIIRADKHKREPKAEQQALTPNEWLRLIKMYKRFPDDQRLFHRLLGDYVEPVKDGSIDKDEAIRLLAIWYFDTGLQAREADRKIAMELPLSKIVEWAENGSLDKGEAFSLLNPKDNYSRRARIRLDDIRERLKYRSMGIDAIPF